jgi:AhpD family alkylhydroperoxidase
VPEFETHTVESAPSASRALLQGLQDQVGFIPNLAATMAGSPTLLDAFLGLRSAVARGSMDPVAREVVAITVALETGCSYCVAAHSTFAVKSGAPAGLVEAVRAGRALDDRRLQALVSFARAVVRREDVKGRARELAGVGFGADQILETLAVIAVPMVASSVFHLTAAELDAAFQPQAWAKTA